MFEVDRSVAVEESVIGRLDSEVSGGELVLRTEHLCRQH